MKPVTKIILGALGVAIALVVALVVAVTLLVDPKAYRPLLVQAVEQATGRQFVLEGDVGLDFLPCCSVTLGPAALRNQPGFPTGDLASVERIALGIEIWPLLARRELALGTVRLDGLTANLLVRADGAANWETAGAPPPQAPSAPAAPAAGQALRIAGIEVRNGRVVYRDETDRSAYLAEDLQLATGRIVPGEPFDLKLDTRLTDETDGTTGTLALRARAVLDDAASRLLLEAPTFDITASGGAVPAARLASRASAKTLAIEFADDTRFAFTALQGEFDLEALTALAGDARGRFEAGEARIDAGVSTELALPALATTLRIEGAEVPGGGIDASITLADLVLDVDKLHGSVASLAADVTGLGARLQVKGGGRLAGADAALDGTLALEPVSPRNLLAVLQQPEPRTADPKVLTRLAGSAQWRLRDDALDLRDLDLRLDDTTLTGTLGVSDFERPAMRFDLALDAIDLDRYLAPEEASGGGKGGEGGAGSGAEDVPVETLRDLRLDGRLRAGKLRYAGIDMDAVDLRLGAADGRVRLDPLQARLYGGEYRGSIGVDATGDTARLALEQQVTALQVGEALAALFQNDKLSGALTGRIAATGTGNTGDALLRTLAGNVDLDLADGVYLGTDLWHEIRSARARLKGDALPPAPAAPRTPIEALQVRGVIANGVLASERMFADIPFIRVSGAGRLDLVGRTMDYRVQASVTEDPVFEDGTRLKDLKGLTIPITLTGPMDKPKVGVELKSLAAGVATQKLRERLLKKLGGDEPPAAGEPPAADGSTAPPADAAPADEQQAEPPKPEKPRDILKRSLRDLLKSPP